MTNEGARRASGGAPEVFNLYLPAGDKARFKAACGHRGETMSRALARMIGEYIAAEDAKKTGETRAAIVDRNTDEIYRNLKTLKTPEAGGA